MTRRAQDRAVGDDVVSAFAGVCQELGEKIALRQGERHISYVELSALADAVADQVTARIDPRPKLIGLFAERSPEAVAGALGILRAGSAYLPLDPGLPDERIAFLVADSGTKVVYAPQPHLAERLRRQGIAGIDVVGWGARPPRRPQRTRTAIQPHHLAYVIYTSGSTGRPKGVMIEHRSLLRLAQNPSLVQPSASDVFVQLAPASADPSLFETWTPLLNGGTLVLPPPGELSLPDLARLIVTENVSVLRLVAPMFAVVVDRYLEALGGLRALISGGDRASPAAVRRALQGLPSCTVINGYGPTETTIYACCHRMKSYQDSNNDGWESVPIGKPLDGVTTFVIDERGASVDRPGTVGELYVGGVGVARGYLGRAELTRERFVELPGLAKRVYRTGDFVRRLPDGVLEFVGRRDHQVKVRGHRVELGEVEAAFTSSALVAQAAVVAVPTPSGVQLEAFVQPRSPNADRAATSNDLRDLLARRLPSYMQPSHVAIVAELPKLPNGKIDRKQLESRLAPRAAPAEPAELTAWEGRLAKIWKSAIGPAAVDPSSNFFAVGGDSLAAMVVAATIEEQLGRRVSLADLVARPILADFAAWLETETAAPPSTPTEAPSGRTRLSPNQEALWFEDQRAADGRYSISLAYQVSGSFRYEAFQRALASVSARHPVLAARIQADGDAVWLCAAEDLDPSCSLTDLSGLGAQAAATAAAELLAREAATPISLERGPLLRVLVVALPSESWLVHFLVHHIVVDDWSLDVFFRDLQDCYQAHAQGTRPNLPPLPLHHADFAAAERQAAVRAESLGADLEHFRRALDGHSMQLEVPTDFARPAEFRAEGERLNLRLDPATFRSAQALARSAAVSRFNLALLSVYVLLARYGRSDDICLGTPVARRSRAGEQSLIGYCLNMLPLRLHDLMDGTVQDVLQRVHAIFLASLSHQDLPFPWLVRALGGRRDPSRSPLFQAVLTYQARPPRGLRLDGTSTEPWPQLSGSKAKFDLAFAFHEVQGGLDLEIEYCSALFDWATVARMLEHLGNVFRWLVEHPSELVRDAELWSPREWQQVCVEWNDTARPFPNRPVHELVEEVCLRQPDKPAVALDNDLIRYGELAQRSDDIAAGLQALGVVPGDRVAVCLARSPALVAALLGVMKAGGVYVPLDVAYPAERLCHILEDARPKVLLVGPGAPNAALRGACPGETVDVSAVAGAARGRRAPVPVAATDPAYIIYTSGSTGRPKGAVIEHRSLLARLSGYAADYPFRSDDLWFQFASAGFDMAIFEQLMPLLIGATSTICADELKQSPEAFVQAVRAQGITVLVLAPSFLRALGKPDLPKVRFLCTGGEAANLEDVRHYAGQKIYLNGYGPTEATICVTTYRADGTETGSRLPVGKPLPNTRLWVVGEDGRPQPAGVSGELWVGGVGLARGYWNNPALTAEKFTQVAWAGGERVYKTGDLVRWRPDGTLDFLGRIDQQVKVRGFRVELGEIEAVLRSCPEVAEAAVVLHRSFQGPRLVAFVVAERDWTPSSEALRTHLARILPSYMVPNAVAVLPALPLTEHHKLDRKRLGIMAADVGASGRGRAPASALELKLAGLWRDMLRTDPRGMDDDFFELGGDSLLVARMLSRVEAETGRRVGIRSFLREPTLAGLVGCVDAGARPGPALDEVVGCAEELAAVEALSFRAPAAAPPRTVLLTGATGFVGSFLLRQLLTATDARVVCLVRATEERAARERIAAALARAGYRGDQGHRLAVAAADLASPGLGLDALAWSRLAAEVDAIFHAGAHVHHFSPYARLRAANVGSTIELLRLATTGRPKSVHHISSLSVFAEAPGLPDVDELSDLAAESHSPARGYSASKWVADRLIGQAAQRGGACQILSSGSGGRRQPARRRQPRRHVLPRAAHVRAAGKLSGGRSDVDESGPGGRRRPEHRGAGDQRAPALGRVPSSQPMANEAGGFHAELPEGHGR